MTLSQNVARVRELIASTSHVCQRSDEVLLLAVSKQQSVAAIREAFQCGLRDFGESYFQEAVVKIQQLHDLPLCWHFIGPIQSNKTKGIATMFDWVHSLSRLSIAEQLSYYCATKATPLNVCVQVNLRDDPAKSGVPCDELTEFVKAIRALPHITLRGLMTILPLQVPPEDQYHLFGELKKLLLALNHDLGLTMDTLSMGMSDDLIPAIQSGATIVRVGRAIFGERSKKGV